MDLKTQLKQLGHRFLSDWNWDKSIRTLDLGLLLGLAILAGSLAANLAQIGLDPPIRPNRGLAPQPRDPSQPFETFLAITTQNLFDVELGADPVANEQPKAPQGDLAPFLAKLELRGVYQGQPKLAVLYNKDTQQEGVFAEEEKVFDGPLLSKIEGEMDQERVLLVMGSAQGWLGLAGVDKPVVAPTPIAIRAENPAGKGVEEKSQSYSENGKDFFLRSEEVDKELNNLPTLLNQARVIPYFKEGQHQGFVIKAIDKGSLYEKLGLQNNDIIKQINGEKIDSPEKAFSLLKMLRNEREITLNLERQGGAKTMVYHIN